MSHLPKEGPNPKDTFIDILATLKAAPIAVRFQVIAADFDESVCMTDSKSSILVYVAMPLSDHTILNLKILYNTIYEKGVNYIVSEYNISKETYKKLPNRLAVL